MKTEYPQTVKEALANPSVRDFAKQIIKEAFNHDIVDSYNDIEYSLYIIRQVVDDTLKNLGCVRKEVR